MRHLRPRLDLAADVGAVLLQHSDLVAQILDRRGGPVAEIVAALLQLALDDGGVQRVEVEKAQLDSAVC